LAIVGGNDHAPRALGHRRVVAQRTRAQEVEVESSAQVTQLEQHVAVRLAPVGIGDGILADCIDGLDLKWLELPQRC
jgi:hypothetical protein